MNAEPGAYEGTWNAFHVELHGACASGARIGADTVDCAKHGPVPVVVIVDAEGNAALYANKTKQNTTCTKNDSPITPAYIRELVAQRRRLVAPLVAQMNAAIIERSFELDKNGQIRIPVSDVCPADTPTTTVQAMLSMFMEEGFAISLGHGKAGEPAFIVEIQS